jgi:mRNA interferase RelE/StbE
VRQGDDRVVYAVDDDERIVEIVKIGHRREVYRN